MSYCRYINLFADVAGMCKGILGIMVGGHRKYEQVKVWAKLDWFSLNLSDLMRSYCCSIGLFADVARLLRKISI